MELGRAGSADGAGESGLLMELMSAGSAELVREGSADGSGESVVCRCMELVRAWPVDGAGERGVC